MKVGFYTHLSQNQIKGHPDCVPLLSFSNAILMPGSSLSVTLEGPQGFTLVGEVMKKDGYIGVVQTLDCLQESDFFTTGTLARLSVADMTCNSITVDLVGVIRFDIQEFIKTKHHFYAARICYKRYTDQQTGTAMDRDSLLRTFQKLLSYLECPDFDLGLLNKCSNEGLIKELMELCPLGNIEKQHILETGELEHQSNLLRQYMEETMLGPLVEFTRH